MAAKVRYTEGTVFKSRGVWRARVTRIEGEGENAVRRTITKTLERDGKPLPCESRNGKAKNSDTAKRLKAAWIEELKAQDAEAAAEAERVANLPDAAKMTVYEYVAHRIKTKAAMFDPDSQTGGIQPSTANTYHYISAHIKEGFPGVLLVDLTTPMVEAWVTSMREAGLKHATIAKAYNLLKSACEIAYEDEKAIDRNPCTKNLTKQIRASGSAKKPNALDSSSIDRLNAGLDLIGHTVLTDAVRVALHTGMRIGEICGLRWMDVDFDRGEIHVRNAIGRDRGSTYNKLPKSGRERVVPIDSEVSELLKARRLAMMEECAELEVPFSQKLYPLGTVAGDYQSPNALSKQWAHLAKALGLVGINGSTPTFHDLRHTFATHAINQQVDAATVAAILGHSSTKMTLDIYSDALPEAKRSAIDRMGEVMGRRSEKALVLELAPTGTEGRN